MAAHIESISISKSNDPIEQIEIITNLFTVDVIYAIAEQ